MRDQRLQELDALIALGWGNQPQNKIPPDVIEQHIPYTPPARRQRPSKQPIQGLSWAEYQERKEELRQLRRIKTLAWHRRRKAAGREWYGRAGDQRGHDTG